MSVLKTIALAVVDQINDAALTLGDSPVEAEFVRIPPEFDPAEDGVKVVVVGVGQGAGDATRETGRNTYTVRVGLYGRADDDAAQDAVDDLRETIFDLLKNTLRLTAYADASLSDIANDPVYDPETLDTKATYVSLITLTYQTFD